MRLRSFRFCMLLLSAAVWFLCIAAVQAQTLRNAREVASHVTPKGGTPSRVSLEAEVTFQDPGLTIFLRDATGVTFIRAAKSNPKVSRGDRLRIEGETHNGLIIGGIKPERIETTARGAEIEARAITPDELASGRWHYDWVSMSGVGRAVRNEGENASVVTMGAGGRTVELRVDEPVVDAAALVDAELRVHGLAAGDINDRRQLVKPYLRVGSPADIEVVKPAPPNSFAAPPVPISDLSARGGDHRVKVRGVALGTPTAGGVFLREGERSIFVRTNAADVKAGDVVEALGFPEMGVFSLELSDAECRVVGSEKAPEPLAVDPKELVEGTDAELIKVNAVVLQRFDRESHTELIAQAGPVNLNITLPGQAPDGVQAQSLVRVTGLCRVGSSRSGGYRAMPEAYYMWPRSEDDIQLLRGVPWWNSQQLALGLAVVAAIALAAFVWIAMLRRQVGRQLSVIEAKAQREAITEERQRIAREFHDTLEQELAGLSLRLDAATTRVTDEKARSLLEQQRKLLMRLQTEARDFVWDLRDPSRQEAPLDAALRSLVEHLQANTTTPLHFQKEGDVPSLPALVQHHALCIAREAMNNAVKYARASRIVVTLRGSPGLLRLEVEDDGAGFDPGAAEALEGHFGLRGMRERAVRIGAGLEVKSESGKGTRIALTLESPATVV